MGTYITADLHLGHRRVADIRGYASTEEHDAVILDAVSALTARDHLWILGDLTVGNLRDETAALAALATATSATLHLVLGNHDSAHPLHRDAHKRHHTFTDVFASVSTIARRRHNKNTVLLSHFPYNGDHTDTDRHPQWRPRDLGAPIIHGHTHSTDKLSHSDTGTPQICVSLDAWNMQLAPLDDILATFPAEAVQYDHADRTGHWSIAEAEQSTDPQ